MRVLSFAVTFALLCALVTPVARAETFSAPEGAFRVDVPVAPGESACVAFPTSRTDKVACADVDLDELREGHAKVGVMALTSHGSRYVVLVNRDMSGTPRPDFYDVAQDTMVRAFRAEAAGAMVREASRRVSTRNGADVVEVELELARSGSAESTTFIGLVPIAGGAYGIIVSGPKDERASVRDLYDSILDSMRVTPPEPVDDGGVLDEADPRMQDPAYRAGYRFGEAFGWIYTLAWWLTSIVAVLVIGVRGHRRWRELDDGPTRASTGPAGARVPFAAERGPVVNPWRRDGARSGALPRTFFAGYDEEP